MPCLLSICRTKNNDSLIVVFLEGYMHQKQLKRVFLRKRVSILKEYFLERMEQFGKFSKKG